MRRAVAPSVLAFTSIALAASLYAFQAREIAGTAVLTGVVLTEASTPEPVRRATVRLSAGAGTSARLVGTDDDGRFTFTALPADSYTLSASKNGFVEAFHGSPRPGRGPGVPIAVADAARVNVTMRMLRGAVVTGTITDVRGNPMPGIAVHAVELRQGAATPSRAMTDDRGIYRIFGLPPGDYLVSAIPRLGPAGGRQAIAGEVLSVSDPELQWARNATASGAMPTANAPAPGRPVAYAPVYFPGAADAAAAAPLKLSAGEERAGANFTVPIVTVARIAGTIIDADGQPVTAATISLFPRRRDRPAPSDLLVSSGALALPRGTVTATGFQIPGVSPGEYTIVARSGSGQRATTAAPAAPPLWSVVDLTVDGTDRSDLMLRLLPGLRLSGTIAFERSTLTPPQDLSALEVTLVAAGSYLGPASTPRAVVENGGAIRFTSIPPGTYLLQATLPRSAPGAPSWTLKSAMLGGRDLADLPLDVTPGAGDPDKLAVTLTDRPAEITGRLVDSSNRPVTRYSIVVFTTERAWWRPNARRIRAVQPATDGSFSVTGLPAGDYAMAAVEDLDSTDLGDPAFLSQLLSAAYKLTLADGERKRQDLRTK